MKRMVKVGVFERMTFEEALIELQSGRAISRGAWHDAHILVRLARHSVGNADAGGEARLAVLTPRPLNKDDFAADDWFTVGSVN